MMNSDEDSRSSDDNNQEPTEYKQKSEMRESLDKEGRNVKRKIIPQQISTFEKFEIISMDICDINKDFEGHFLQESEEMLKSKIKALRKQSNMLVCSETCSSDSDTNSEDTIEVVDSDNEIEITTNREKTTNILSSDYEESN